MRREIVGVLLLMVGCRTAGGPGAYPLYPKIGEGLGSAKVSLLRGPVALVDGRDVTNHGMTFELLPGCHIVTMQRNVGQGGENGAWAANLPRIVFAFEMKPAHSYTIETRLDQSSGPWSHVAIVAEEHAPGGAVLRVSRARGSDITDCHHWATAQGP